MIAAESGGSAVIATGAVAIVSLLVIVVGLAAFGMAMLCCKKQNSSEGRKDAELDAKHQPWYLREQQTQQQQQQQQQQHRQPAEKEQQVQGSVQDYVQDQQHVQQEYVQEQYVQQQDQQQVTQQQQWRQQQDWQQQDWQQQDQQPQWQDRQPQWQDRQPQWQDRQPQWQDRQPQQDWQQQQEPQQQWQEDVRENTAAAVGRDDVATPIRYDAFKRPYHVPRPQSRLCRFSTSGDDDLGDYIKMNPAPHGSSATLPAASRGQPPNYKMEFNRLCMSYEGLDGILNDVP